MGLHRIALDFSQASLAYGGSALYIKGGLGAEPWPWRGAKEGRLICQLH